MTRPLWPDDREEQSPLFHGLFESSLHLLDAPILEDRFGLVMRRLLYRRGHVVAYGLGTRHLPVSGIDGERFLRCYAPKELELLSPPAFGPGILSVTVLVAHPRGELSAAEESALLRRFGLTADTVHERLGAEANLYLSESDVELER